MSLAGVLEACCSFDARVVELEMALRVVLRSTDEGSAKIDRTLVLLTAAKDDLYLLVHGARRVFHLQRHLASEDEQREVGARLTMVQVVLANRVSAMTLAERVQVQLAEGATTAREAERWAAAFFGLVPLELAVEEWTDSLGVPVCTAAVEA